MKLLLPLLCTVVQVKRHPSDSVDEAVQQLWREWPAASRNVWQQGGSCRADCAAGLQVTRGPTAVTTDVPEGVWQPGEGAQPPVLSFSINICHSLLLLCSWRHSGDKNLFSLTSLPHLASATQPFLADLQFLLQISPRKAILIAVLLQTMQ